VFYRLMALARVVGEGDGEAWTMTVDGEEYKLVSEAMVRAAAKAPLKEAGVVGDIAFDAKQLLEIALQEAESEGSA
jgi:hypothetical protein